MLLSTIDPRRLRLVHAGGAGVCSLRTYDEDFAFFSRGPAVVIIHKRMISPLSPILILHFFLNRDCIGFGTPAVLASWSDFGCSRYHAFRGGGARTHNTCRPYPAAVLMLWYIFNGISVHPRAMPTHVLNNAAKGAGGSRPHPAYVGPFPACCLCACFFFAHVPAQQVLCNSLYRGVQHCYVAVCILILIVVPLTKL